MNITMLHLSLSSAFCYSPFLSGNNNCIQHSFFKKCFYSVFFLDPAKLKAEKNIFLYGIGSILISKTIGLNGDISQRNINNSNYNDFRTDIGQTGNLLVICDCYFDQIKGVDQNLIEMRTNSKTFLITRCTFVSCSNTKPIFYISTSSTTISHICASDFETKDGSANNVPAFIGADTPDGSFLKFIYSTIVGNKKALNQNNVFNFAGTSHFLFQCNNISKIETKTDSNYFFFDVARLKCLTIQMNTFQYLKSKHIFRFNLGSLDTHDACFIGYSNIIDNYYSESYIRVQNDQNADMNFRECYFTCTNRLDKFIGADTLSFKISIENCYFDLQYSDLKSYSTNNLVFTSKNSNTLAHYTVQNICDGVNITKGSVCGDDKCLVENMGCNEDKFDFKENEISYTFPGVDTEPPTLTFTSSSVFSPSGDFSRSSMFTETGDFTKSAMFTETNDFTRSTMFTETGDFTRSSMFTETGDFTQSTMFTESKKFTETSFFSESGFFSKSTMFTQSTVFTETTDFTRSFLFSYSADFTESLMFSESKGFKETSFFSKSSFFTGSTMFTQSTAFTETTDFTRSSLFSYSSDFTQSHIFSESKGFKETSYFSKSSFFTRSTMFTETIDFTRSSFFSDSTKFSESNEFSKTIFFSKSNDFTKTDGFTTSFYFSNSNAFSKTTQFTESIDFSASNYFSSSLAFTESNGLHSTDVFTPSNTFSRSNYFSFSYYFSNSHYFSSTLDFTKTGVFTLTKEFSKTNYFSLSINFTESNEFSPSFVKQLTDSFIFSPSGTFIKKSDVVIHIKTEEKPKITTGMKVGIGVVAGAAALAAIIVGLIFLRKRKYNQVEDMSEGVEIHEDFAISNINNNPLLNMMNEDDPFEDEFD